jgi:16S rRNA processing protein RimM
VSDLVGLEALEADTGVRVGRVTGVVDNPAHDLLEIETEDGKKFLLPMVDVFVPRVDIAAGICHVFVTKQGFSCLTIEK